MATPLLRTPLSRLEVPATLQASLMARLDHLGARAKELSQVGAAIGREFHELLVSVCATAEEDVKNSLYQLCDAGILFRRGTPPQASFSFKHALVRDAAYGTLLRSHRQLLHERIALVLERQSPEVVIGQPELIAQHCAEAGLIQKAIYYWLKAGQQAMARSAMAEAAAQLKKGLDVARQMPRGLERQRSELDLQTALGAALTAAKGYAAPETGDVYARARRLCEELEDATAFARVGYGQWLYHVVRGEVQRSHEVAEEILSFADKTGNDEARILGHRVLGVSLFESGQFTASRAQLDLALSLLEKSRTHACGQCSGSGCAHYDPDLDYNDSIIARLHRTGQTRSQYGACASGRRICTQSSLRSVLWRAFTGGPPGI